MEGFSKTPFHMDKPNMCSKCICSWMGTELFYSFVDSFFNPELFQPNSFQSKISRKILNPLPAMCRRVYVCVFSPTQGDHCDFGESACVRGGGGRKHELCTFASDYSANLPSPRPIPN